MILDFNKLEGFIFAAGLGTRLRPLTTTRPKALVEVGGRKLIDIVIERLREAGVRRVVVNVHHFAQQIIDHISSSNYGVEVLISDEREYLLDTGGGLKKAYNEGLLSGTGATIIHNVDILSQINLQKMVEYMKFTAVTATLAVSHRDTSRYLLFDDNDCLAGWHNTKSGEYRWVSNEQHLVRPLAYSGIAILAPEFFSAMNDDREVFSIIETYLAVAKCHRINFFEHSPDHWLDVCKPETLAEAIKYL